MSHFKLSKNELDLFVRSMKSYRKKLDDDHPNDYPYMHPISKEKRYLDLTIGKLENELKTRSMRPHKVTS